MNNEINMNQQQAINVLIQAAQIAQSKGVFTLEDAATVLQAIRVFVPNTTDNSIINQQKEEQKSE